MMSSRLHLCVQERIQLSQEQLTALIKVRRALLAHIGALLAEREQIGMRIRVSTTCHTLVIMVWVSTTSQIPVRERIGMRRRGEHQLSYPRQKTGPPRLTA